jgi:hypothetical protein
MNKIIAIGFTGSKAVYLNISRVEALERYAREHGDSYIDKYGELKYWRDSIDSYYIEEFEFNDEFNAYAVWPKGGW